MLLIDSMKDISQKIILENQNDDEASLLSQIDAELKEDKEQKGTKNSSNFVYIYNLTRLFTKNSKLQFWIFLML